MNATNGNSTIPAHIRKSASYAQALAFMKAVQAKEGVEYDWVIEHAKDLWDERRKHFASLDEKADSIIKYLGGGLGLLSVGILAKVDANNAYLVGWTLPAVVCAIASLFLAAIARKPNSVPTLPPIDAAVGYAEEGKEKKEAQAIFLGQWHLICEGQRLANRRKAQWIVWATFFYCLALAFLILPLAFAGLYPPQPK